MDEDEEINRAKGDVECANMHISKHKNCSFLFPHKSPMYQVYT